MSTKIRDRPDRPEKMQEQQLLFATVAITEKRVVQFFGINASLNEIAYVK